MTDPDQPLLVLNGPDAGIRIASDRDLFEILIMPTAPIRYCGNWDDPPVSTILRYHKVRLATHDSVEFRQWFFWHTDQTPAASALLDCLVALATNNGDSK